MEINLTVSLADFVDIVKLANRAGYSTLVSDLMDQLKQPQKIYIRFNGFDPDRRIAAIKAVREVNASFGLKDAKDLVEGPVGSNIVILDNPQQFKLIDKVLTQAGVRFDVYKE